MIKQAINEDAKRLQKIAGLLKEEEERVKEIRISELTPLKQAQVKAFAKILGGSIRRIFYNITGERIAHISSEGMSGIRVRIDAKSMKRLLDAKARWIEVGQGNVAIGF